MITVTRELAEYKHRHLFKTVTVIRIYINNVESFFSKDTSSASDLVKRVSGRSGDPCSSESCLQQMSGHGIMSWGHRMKKHTRIVYQTNISVSIYKNTQMYAFNLSLCICIRHECRDIISFSCRNHVWPLLVGSLFTNP